MKHKLKVAEMGSTRVKVDPKMLFKHNKRGGTYTSPECGVNGNNVNQRQSFQS